MDFLIGLLSGISPQTLYIAAIIVGLLGIFALVKKAIKIGALIIIIALAITYGGVAVNNIMEEYNVNIDKTSISVTINNRDYNLDFKYIDTIEVLSKEDNNVTLNIKGTNDSELEVTVPKIMLSLAKPIAEKNDVVIIDSSN